MSALAAASALVLVTGLLGNLIRIPLFSSPGKTAPLMPLDVAVLALLCVGAFEAARQRRLVLDRPSLWGLGFMAFALIGLLSAGPRFGLSLPEFIFAGAYLARWTAYFALFVFVSALLRAEDVPRLVTIFRRGVLLFACFGIVQSLFLPDFAFIVHPDAARYTGYDPQGFRLVSTFLDPNYAGCLLVVALSLWGGRLLAGASVRWSEGAVLVVALSLTVSRGSLLAALGAASVIVLAHGVSARVLRAGGAILAALLVAAPFVVRYGLQHAKFRIDASALSRLIVWERDLILIRDHPILGIGFNTFGFVAPRHYGWIASGNGSFGLDGGLLFIAALTGLVGVFLYLCFLISVVRSARASWRDEASTPEHRGVAYAVVGSVVAICIQAMFTNALLLPLLLAPCFLLWSLPRVMRRSSSRDVYVIAT